MGNAGDEEKDEYTYCSTLRDNKPKFVFPTKVSETFRRQTLNRDDPSDAYLYSIYTTSALEYA